MPDAAIWLGKLICSNNVGGKKPMIKLLLKATFVAAISKPSFLGSLKFFRFTFPANAKSFADVFTSAVILFLSPVILPDKLIISGRFANAF